MQTTYNKSALRTEPSPPWWRVAVLMVAQAWERPVWSAIIAWCIYALIAVCYGSLLRLSNYPYFNYLADAFLHGQLHLRVLPRFPHDLSLFEGRYYLYWPPFPAIVLLPLVAVFGVGFSDVLATTLNAALNVGLVALLLRRSNARGITQLSSTQRGLLVLFFALGTVQITLAPFGRVWAFGQLVGFSMVALCYLAVLTQRGLWAFTLAGLAAAAAFLTRNHLVLAALWPAWYLLAQHWGLPWRRLGAYVLLSLVPLICAVLLIALYNWLRFGSALNNGLDYHRMASRFATEYQQYGAFSLHYLPTNLLYQYLAYPLPYRGSSLLGGSLFVLSPPFFAALRSLTLRDNREVHWMLAATIVLVATPIALLMGTGWVQWGPRYTLDFTVPLLLLTAAGLRRWPLWGVAGLVAISLGHYAVGIIYLAPYMLR